jgi:ATP:corrinoid adenosyltransferase
LNDAKDQEYENFKAKRRAKELAKEIADDEGLRTKISEEVTAKLDPRLKNIEEVISVLKKTKMYTNVLEDDEFNEELGD